MSEDKNTNTPEIEIPVELAERLADGEITLAEFLGLTRNTLYAIADVGYQMLTSGKLDQAMQIYKGLVAADPYDSVFHCHLAAVYHKLGQLDEAREEYTQSLQFNFANVDALAGRGEIYYNQGKLSEAFNDLKAAIDYDKDGKLASTDRAKAIMLAMKEMVETHQAKQSN